MFDAIIPTAKAIPEIVMGPISKISSKRQDLNPTDLASSPVPIKERTPPSLCLGLLSSADAILLYLVLIHMEYHPGIMTT